MRRGNGSRKIPPVLQLDAFRVDAGASSVHPRSRQTRPGRVEAAGIGMIGIHVRDGIGFGVNKRFASAISVRMSSGLEIDNTWPNPPQMRAGDYAIKGKVGETCVHFASDDASNRRSRRRRFLVLLRRPMSAARARAFRGGSCACSSRRASATRASEECFWCAMPDSKAAISGRQLRSLLRSQRERVGSRRSPEREVASAPERASRNSFLAAKRASNVLSGVIAGPRN